MADFVKPHLTADDEVEAVLADALTGITWPLFALALGIPAAVGGLIGAAALHNVLLGGLVGGGVAGAIVGTILYGTVVRSVALAVTSRCVLLVRRSPLTSRLNSIDADYPRKSVSVAAYQFGTFYGTLRLTVDGKPDVTLNVRRAHRRGAGEVVAALGATALG